MNFIEAIEAAKNGHRIRRPGHVEGTYYATRNGSIYLFTGNGPYDRACAVLLSDVMATDWEIAGEWKEVSFAAAMTAFAAGKTVRRLGARGPHLDSECGADVESLDEGIPLYLYDEDISSLWEVKP